MGWVMGPFPFWQQKEQEKIQKKIEEDTATPAEKWKFHNFMQGEILTMQNLLMFMMILKLAKIPGGLEVIKSLGREFIKGIFDTMHSMGQAAAANKVAAWANPYLTSLVFERFGFVDAARMAEFRIGLSIISGAGIAEGFADTLQGFFPFANPEPSEYPSDITFSARTSETVESVTPTVTWNKPNKKKKG